MSGSPFVVDGLGAVGLRVVRELVATAEHGVIEVRTSHSKRLDIATDAFGDRVRAWHPKPNAVGGTAIVSREAGVHVDAVREHLTAGRDVVSVSDDPAEVTALLALDSEAEQLGRRLLVGAAFSPGLSCVLVGHAAGALDDVSSMRVAMAGAGGPRCVERRARAAGAPAPAWREGEWAQPEQSVPQLVWFPDPIGPLDVIPGDLVEPMVLHRAWPAVSSIDATMAVPRAVPLTERVASLPRRRQAQPEPLGAIRVEVAGTRDGDEAMVTYAVVDRPAVAAGALVAVVAPRIGELEPGVHTCAQLERPVEILRELARRGVKAATFEPSI